MQKYAALGVSQGKEVSFSNLHTVGMFNSISSSAKQLTRDS